MALQDLPTATPREISSRSAIDNDRAERVGGRRRTPPVSAMNDTITSKQTSSTVDIIRHDRWIWNRRDCGRR